MRTKYIPNLVYVDPPRWYKNDTMFKAIKDWTDEELAIEHVAVRERMYLCNMEEL